ncbi:hypothetical protein GGR57DRAFT_510667 [Xylariaceae sp. FL1272]|nr:hypothetical protein GGR57DRAFT_510667 [Xylariaceae sp. FL1272]
MASSQDGGIDYYPVHLGTWTNWSRGPVFGQTLTLTRREGDLLIAFTALFVALVSNRGWRIMSFALHHFNARTTPQGAVYHQYQAILRNSDTQTSILQLVNLIWANCFRDVSLIRPLIILTVASIYTVAFTVAGGFSSQISTAVGTEVLIESKNCGWYMDNFASIGNAFRAVAVEAGEITNANNYAQQCYSNDSTGILDCGRLTTQKLPATVNTQAPCPFREDVCRSSLNILIDSGYIDSHDLGLNTPPSQRMHARMVIQCAPMQTQGFTSRMNAAGSTSSFLAPSSLFPRNADLAIALLSGNGVFHTEPSDDEWYRVSSTDSRFSLGNGNGSSSGNPFYPPLEDGSPMGCALQWQFCSQDTAECGILGSINDALNSATHIFDIDGKFNETEQYNSHKAAYFRYFAIVLSKAQTVPGTQGPLPSNQWQLDVTHWAEIQLADAQLAFLRTAYYNPADSTLLGLRQNFTGAETKLCSNQKIRSTNHSSFSLFGLLFTFIVGFAIIATSFLLEPTFWLLYRRYGYNAHATLEWTTNTTLQLQRLAHEARGFGTWSRATNRVPITQVNEMLGCLDLSNPHHPLLETRNGRQLQASTARHSAASGNIQPQTALTLRS